MSQPYELPNLVSVLRAVLNAKLQRLLSRPIIVPVTPSEPPAAQSKMPSLFAAMQQAARIAPETSHTSWRVNEEGGTWRVSLSIDYDDLWRGREKEILQALSSTVEQQQQVTFLTDEQRRLLEESPREFLAREPRPEQATLISFTHRVIGGSDRVDTLELAGAPETPEAVTSIAILPNLVQIERQLAALEIIEKHGQGSPIWPLRALVGLAPMAGVPWGRNPDFGVQGRLDEHQVACVKKAVETPHFAVIHGPPGAGKTTVITEIVRSYVDAGMRVLIVSPTHVAVDNVVEKLKPSEKQPDTLAPISLPIRYASSQSRVAPAALPYWVNSKAQKRLRTIEGRVEAVIRSAQPASGTLFDLVKHEEAGSSPLARMIAASEQVVCGTPIGVLSFDSVKNAAPGTFDVLIVDEVSKMTLPDFLAIAVKARRWVLVGDPIQLPPFLNAPEDAGILDDTYSPLQELASSVVSVWSDRNMKSRAGTRFLVVAPDAPGAAEAIRDQLAHATAAGGVLGKPLSVDVLSPGTAAISVAQMTFSGVMVCTPAQYEASLAARPTMSVADTRTLILVQRGLLVSRPAPGSGAELADEAKRSQGSMLKAMYDYYHAEPWTRHNKQNLEMVSDRTVLDYCVPSPRLLAAGCGGLNEFKQSLAARYATSAMSVFDWLTGDETSQFKVLPHSELAQVVPTGIVEGVRPWAGILKNQYRMESALSAVPRKLFYRGEALLNGRKDKEPDSGVELVHVASDRNGEENNEEATKTLEMLFRLNANPETARRARENGPVPVMIIAPYGDHVRLLEKKVGEALGSLPHLNVEVCTLDKCQGREADIVIINLVRRTASPFMSTPKRWNVALTRARAALMIVGNIEAFREEGRKARAKARNGWPTMSLLARIVEEYDNQKRGRH